DLHARVFPGRRRGGTRHLRRVLDLRHVRHVSRGWQYGRGGNGVPREQRAGNIPAGTGTVDWRPPSDITTAKINLVAITEDGQCRRADIGSGPAGGPL